MLHFNSIQDIASGQEREVRNQIWTGIMVFTLGIGVMWLMNILGLRFLNVLIALAALAAIAIVGSRTKVLIGFSLIGIIVHRLQSKSEENGILAGLGWLLNLLVAIAFLFALSAFVLTSLNYAIAPGSFMILALGALTGTLAHLFFKEDNTTIKSCIMALVCIIVFAASWQPLKATMSEFFDTGEPQVKTSQQKRPYRYEKPAQQTVTSAVPVGAPASVQVPSCLSGKWVQVNIPKGWSISLAWNEKAAAYKWRSVSTSTWGNSPQGGVDSVRVCALHEAYAGDHMPITWHKV